MRSAEHCAPDEYRASLRATVRTAVRVSLERCAPNARSVWAATLGISHGLLDRAIARDGDKAIHVADALAAPEPVRVALARLLLGERFAVVEVRAAEVALSDAARVLVKEAADAVTASLEKAHTPATLVDLHREARELAEAAMGVAEAAKAERLRITATSLRVVPG